MKRQRLADTIKRNPIRGGLWIDDYNRRVSEIAGTIYTGVNSSNHIWVVVLTDEADTDKRRDVDSTGNEGRIHPL